MLKKSDNETKEEFKAFIHSWFKLIAQNKWNEAFSQIDLSPNHGEAYTPETFRNEIENDHFCVGTVFRKQFPEGVIYENPEKIEGDGRCELYEPENLDGYEFECDVPLNGEWSDLTSGWQFINAGSFYKVRLDWLHVL